MFDSLRRFSLRPAALVASVARLLGAGRGARRALVSGSATGETGSRALPVRRLTILLGAIISITTALSVPIGYGVIAYLKEGDALMYKAELSAARAAQYIYAPHAPWTYDTDQLAAMAEIRTTKASRFVQSIVDMQGATMMRKGDELAWPTFARRAPIFAAGKQVGSAEVTASLWPLLMEVASVALGSLALAVAACFAFTVLPLNALDRTLAEVETTNEKFRRHNFLLDTALENMIQGIAMFDGDGRVVVANDRFATLYGIDPADIKPGTSLMEIIALRKGRGFYPGRAVEDITRELRELIADRRVNRLLNTFPNGRTFLAAIQPMEDGGWVTTHEDITEREQLNARLAEQNTLLKQREEELELQNRRFNAAIDNMSQGLCLFDAEQRVVFANRRFSEVYKLDPEAFKPGATLREILAARAASAVYGDIDAQKFVADGVASFTQEVSQIVRLADGRFISVLRRPLPGGGVVSTHEDITERERLKERLEQQNEQLDAAMNNMAQGLAMYDAEQRLVVCNDDFATMYGLTAEQVRPGTSVREIVEARMAKGCYTTDNPAGLVDKLVAQFGKIQSEVHHLADGRIVNVSCRQIASGGHVITHQDITELQRLNARLEQQHGLLLQHEETLRLRNMHLDAAVNNMVQGLAMFDADLRVVLANQRYIEIYGLKADQVAPGTTLQQILEYRIGSGTGCGKTAEEMVRSMVARSNGRADNQYISTLTDGRHISVSIQRMADGGIVTTHQDITDQRRSEEKIVHMALHDALTDLPNRVLLNERLETALTRVQRGDDVVAVHLLDLDHFKTVNDTMGHPTGDKLLKMVTERLRAIVRETDTIARMGGDEFAVLQVGICQPADATALALRIITAVSAPYEIDGQQVVIGTSVGIAIGPDDGCSPEQLIRNSDLALYRAKDDGRGTYRFFSSEMDAQMQVRRTMEYDLRKALTANQFELHYQPVVDLGTDTICGVEALIRWRHPDKGLIPPGEFIPLAEEIGFIIQLGEWALREACFAARNWPEHIRVAVNLSPVQFRNTGFVQVVIRALAASGLAPDRLELEITESVLLQDNEATLNTLFQLRALGVRIAMDDFGTGCSSLSYLQSFPFDKIKIDRSFVTDIADGVGSLNIVRAVAAMANGLGMITTAEGVETRQQLDTIRAEGCTEMQGYLFSKPLPLRELEALLAGDSRASFAANFAA
ncbi:MAG TPA: PAS-domain containing protein [Hyphomicrobiaceae bacterium]|nr:PAS-domain containing protein [Hyphomicrobiaceae bacterium]